MCRMPRPTPTTVSPPTRFKAILTRAPCSWSNQRVTVRCAGPVQEGGQRRYNCSVPQHGCAFSRLDCRLSEACAHPPVQARASGGGRMCGPGNTPHPTQLGQRGRRGRRGRWAARRPTLTVLREALRAGALPHSARRALCRLLGVGGGSATRSLLLSGPFHCTTACSCFSMQLWPFSRNLLHCSAAVKEVCKEDPKLGMANRRGL